MHLLSPAHLVFVLWLLAAAAPVATVLINGTMVPFVGTSLRVEAGTAVESKAEEARTESRPRAAIVWREDAFGVWVPEFSAPGISASVLHTELQRHRPRGV